mmetsp:Transcript_21173/g.32812  ORF Transcript_21173/g.32812 Transcript_21173/m.32812 type:complete len:192 (-) Transcript_21173:67-642(-)
MSAEKKNEHDIDYADPEADAGAVATGLKDVEKVTGTEGEVCVYKQRVKLFRFRDNQWKERGIGNAKLLRNDKEKKIRFVMRQEKTLKPVGNFHLSEKPSCELKPMANSDKAFMWVCHDFSEGEGAVEKLAIRLQNVDLAKDFKEKFEAAQQFNIDAKAGKEDLVWAETVEDVEEVVEDDIETNKTADVDGE